MLVSFLHSIMTRPIYLATVLLGIVLSVAMMFNLTVALWAGFVIMFIYIGFLQSQVTYLGARSLEMEIKQHEAEHPQKVERLQQLQQIRKECQEKGQTDFLKHVQQEIDKLMTEA